MDVEAAIAEKLSVFLNKDINTALVGVLVRFYQSGSFESQAAVLGLSSGQAAELQTIIAANIQVLTKDKPKVRQKDLKEKLREKRRVEFSYDDEPELVAPKPKPRPTFKKIKKEDAERLKREKADGRLDKQEHNKEPDAEITKSNPTLSELAEKERFDYEIEDGVGPDSLDGVDGLGPYDIENDREWYLGAAEDTAVDEFRPRRKTGSGGRYVNGEYVDFDHDDSYSDISRVPLVASLDIPPFLAAHKENIVLQLASGSGLRIGPTISPVKDPNSELAMQASRGSFVVKEKRSSIEKQNQAKERSSLKGTALGNVLGVSEGDDGPGELTQPTVEETTDAEAIAAQRRSLPAFTVRDDLIRAIRDNQVTVVIGETGSGKTTQLTQYLYEEHFGGISNGVKRVIGCTQPRRVAAMSVASRVSQEMGVRLGKEVGYTIRFEDKTDRSTVIKYMTEGILLREILMDPYLDHYLCIIMDEAHERSVNTDVLLGLLKQLLVKRRDLKVIITSATMNADRFSRFFGNAPQFVIPGRTFPVEVFFSKSSNNDYVEAAVKQVMTIHLSNASSDGDILVFMTGQEDIEITCELIKEKLELLEDPPPLDVLPIYSTLPADLQRKIFQKSLTAIRKVVVATNIAETSLTIDGIKYVVDSGLVKQKVYSPKLGMDTLQVIPISYANAQQRSGRAGRTGPGSAFRLYTERATNPQEMFVQPIPEIQRTNLNSVMLLLKSLNVDDIMKFAFLDPPPGDLLSCALYDLWSIGALNNLGKLTELGRSMMMFPFEPTLAKLLVLSCRKEFHCSEDIIKIVAMLSVPSVYYRPKERAREADVARERFLVSDSDHLTLLNIFNQWETSWKKVKNFGKVHSWCARNFLHAKSLLRAKDIKNQLLMIMKNNRLPLWSARSDDDIRKCLCAAYYQQLSKLVKTNPNGASEFVNLRHSYMKMYLHPTSALNDGVFSSPYVVYHELILTTKEYMNCATVVDPLWLLEYGYVFYEAAESYKPKLKGYVDVNREWFKRTLSEDHTRYEQPVVRPTKTKIKPRRAF